MGLFHVGGAALRALRPGHVVAAAAAAAPASGAWRAAAAAAATAAASASAAAEAPGAGAEVLKSVGDVSVLAGDDPRANATLEERPGDAALDAAGRALMEELDAAPPGLPPLAEILASDPDAEAKAARRAELAATQGAVAATRERVVNELGQAYAVGRRKAATARVWLSSGSGAVTVNDRAVQRYFCHLKDRADVIAPFVATNTLGAFDTKVAVSGGGTTGQAGAIRLAVANALQRWDPDHRPVLKSAGYLTRDSRIVERKKPGKAGARKSFQWVKR